MYYSKAFRTLYNSSPEGATELKFTSVTTFTVIELVGYNSILLSDDTQQKFSL